MKFNRFISRRWMGACSLAVLATATLALSPMAAQAQSRKDTVVLGMTLEPTSLDPTMAPAAAIGEIVHYNILEGLTKINVDGSVSPLLAESWKMDADGKAFTFKLRKGVKFSDGSAFDAEPSENFTPLRSLKVKALPSASIFQLSASRGETEPSTLILVRPSRML